MSKQKNLINRINGIHNKEICSFKALHPFSQSIGPPQFGISGIESLDKKENGTPWRS